MGKLVDYILVKVNPDKSSRDVIEKISEGYELHGYPFFCKYESESYAVYQALIKKDESKN